MLDLSEIFTVLTKYLLLIDGIATLHNIHVSIMILLILGDLNTKKYA